MLKRILFDMTSAVMDSKAVRELLQTLESAQIESVLNTAHAPSPEHTAATNSSKTPNILTSSGGWLVITDSASGISSAQTAGIPCIGYTPPETTEDMSGAYALFEDFSSIDVSYLCRTHAHAVGYPADILTTERLAVRELSKEDFPTLYAMCTEPSTAFFMEETLSDYDTELEKHNAYLRNIYPFFDLALWGVYEKTSGKLIGRAGFSLPEDDSDSFSIGYLIDVPYRRCGFAKELIPALLSYAKGQGYSEVSARIKKGNIASVKSLEQCGFPFERRADITQGILTYIIDLTV